MTDLDESDDNPPELVEVLDDNREDAIDTSSQPRSKVPITIITGYLGAGKSTLLKYILTEQHGKKIAVILNVMAVEFGDSADIEKTLTISQDGQEIQEWLEVGNGCICCSVKDQGVNAIESLMERNGAFDYILLETTGLADPGNIAPLFWVDEGLGSTIYLDGIVTLVDAKNIARSLNEAPLEDAKHHYEGPVLTTAHLQISHADVIVLNKADLVTSDELLAVRNRIESINSLAKIYVTQNGQVPRLDGFLLDLHAYDDVKVLEVAKKGHSHLDPSISTMSFSVPVLGTSELHKLDVWLRAVLWENTIPGLVPEPTDFEIHRLKARLPCQDGTIKIVQGVREIFEIKDSMQKLEGMDSITTEGKFVFIGRNIADIKFETSYIGSLSKPSR